MSEHQKSITPNITDDSFKQKASDNKQEQPQSEIPATGMGTTFLTFLGEHKLLVIAIVVALILILVVIYYFYSQGAEKATAQEQPPQIPPEYYEQIQTQAMPPYNGQNEQMPQPQNEQKSQQNNEKQQSDEDPVKNDMKKYTQEELDKIQKEIDGVNGDTEEENVIEEVITEDAEELNGQE